MDPGEGVVASPPAKSPHRRVPSPSAGSEPNNTNGEGAHQGPETERAGFRGSKRRQVKKACTNCRRGHRCCEDIRPCKRCRRMGLECDEGGDEEPKKYRIHGPDWSAQPAAEQLADQQRQQPQPGPRGAPEGWPMIGALSLPGYPPSSLVGYAGWAGAPPPPSGSPRGDATAPGPRLPPASPMPFPPSRGPTAAWPSSRSGDLPEGGSLTETVGLTSMFGQSYRLPAPLPPPQVALPRLSDSAGVLFGAEMGSGPTTLGGVTIPTPVSLTGSAGLSLSLVASAGHSSIPGYTLTQSGGPELRRSVNAMRDALEAAQARGELAGQNVASLLESFGRHLSPHSSMPITLQASLDFLKTPSPPSGPSDLRSSVPKVKPEPQAADGAAGAAATPAMPPLPSSSSSSPSGVKTEGGVSPSHNGPSLLPPPTSSSSSSSSSSSLSSGSYPSMSQPPRPDR